MCRELRDKMEELIIKDGGTEQEELNRMNDLEIFSLYIMVTDRNKVREVC